MELVTEQRLVSFLYFQGFIWLCRTARLPTNYGQDQIERNLNKVFHNVETGQKLTHDDSGILVPLDKILDLAVAHPEGNKSQNVGHDCPAGSSLSELDVCLSPAQAAMFDSSGEQYGGRQKRDDSSNRFALWNNGVIPFVFNSTFSPADTDAILSAMTEWERSTCIRFRQAVGGDRDLVVFKDGIRCSTNIGRIGGEQTVALASNCRTKRILIHELGHVIGLIHEHQRYDRDIYVNVIYENVRNVSQERYQFSKLLSEPLTERMVNYDYTSIMHYGRNYFAKSPELTTLHTTDSYYQDIIGTAERPSFSDLETVNLLYHCSASCPPSLHCGDSCFMDSRCDCICRASVDQTFHYDPGLYRNNLLDTTCEFFARRGDCAGSMKDTIGHLCIQSCLYYQLQLNRQIPAVTSTHYPSIQTPQSRLVTVLWGSNPNLQTSGKLNSSSLHNTMFKNINNTSSSHMFPVNTPPPWPQYQKGNTMFPVNTPPPRPQYQKGNTMFPVNIPSPWPQYQKGNTMFPVNIPSPWPQYQKGNTMFPVNTPSPRPQYQKGNTMFPVNTPSPRPQHEKGNTMFPVNTPSPRPQHEKGNIQFPLQVPQHTSHSSAPPATFPRVIQQNISNLYRPRNVRRQQLQTLNTSRDVLQHQRRILNNSTKTKPRNQTYAQATAVKRRLDNKNFRHVVSRTTTRIPSVRPVSLYHQNQISLRALPYRIYSQQRLPNSEDRREILQPPTRHRQPIKDPYDINSFIEFVIARHPSISQQNAGTNNGNMATNVHNSGRAEIQTRNFATNCESTSCNLSTWKRLNQFITRPNVSSTGETDKLNNRHLVRTDLPGPEFGLTVNLKPPNINDNIKTDRVINDRSMQAPVSVYLIKNDITSQSLANTDHSSSSRYSMEQGLRVPWGPPPPDLTQAPSGSTAESHQPRQVSQSIDTLLTNTDFVPQS